MIKKCAGAIIALSILTISPAIRAQCGIPGAKRSAIMGILIDKNCSNKALKDQDPYANAGKHSRTCALLGGCANSGYGVITQDGKFLKFDARGDEQAKALLEKSERKSNLTVSVEGALKGDVLEVKSIKEQSAE